MRRRLADSVDVTFRRASPRINRIARCSVLEEVSIEICLIYDVHSMRFSVDVKRTVRKIWRENEREQAFRETIPWIPLQSANVNVFADKLVSLSPRVANLGYAVSKYDALRWREVRTEPREFSAYDLEGHEYGQFAALRGFVHFMSEFEEEWTREEMGKGTVCGVERDGVPFVMCIENGVVRFENVHGDEDDGEFESMRLDLESDEGWDEVNAMSTGDDEVIGVEKCVYLSTMRMCVTKEETVVTASVKKPL